MLKLLFVQAKTKKLKSYKTDLETTFVIVQGGIICNNVESKIFWKNHRSIPCQDQGYIQCSLLEKKTAEFINQNI